MQGFQTDIYLKKNEIFSGDGFRKKKRNEKWIKSNRKIKVKKKMNIVKRKEMNDNEWRKWISERMKTIRIQRMKNNEKLECMNMISI